MQFLAWIAFALAAIFEVGGDAVVRMGIKSNNIILMLLGAATLGGYGLIVNSVIGTSQKFSASMSACLLWLPFCSANSYSGNKYRLALGSA
jgi:drug/metabolite transporter superfamily protein YnfA